MPPPRAQIGERWWVDGLGWRVIVSIQHHKKQGRLYGVRDAKCPEYPLTPVSADRARGRFLRSRSLLRKYVYGMKKRTQHQVDTNFQRQPHDPRELARIARGVLCAR
jgi:hypothetical protein